jgi:hypothetical protein
MSYILVIFLAWNGSDAVGIAADHITFPSKLDCEMARSHLGLSMIAKDWVGQRSVFMECVPEGRK